MINCGASQTLAHHAERVIRRKILLSNGRSYGLADGNYEIDSVAGLLALRRRTALGSTTFTIRNIAR